MEIKKKKVSPRGFEPQTSGSPRRVMFKTLSYKTGALTRLSYGLVNAPTGNRTQATTLATSYCTTQLLARIFDLFV